MGGVERHLFRAVPRTQSPPHEEYEKSLFKADVLPLYHCRFHEVERDTYWTERDVTLISRRSLGTTVDA